MSRRYYRSSLQMSELLPPVLYLVVEGFVEVVFPNSRPSRPSSWVKLTPKKVIPSEFLGFASSWDGVQWNALVVPLLENISVNGWLGLPNQYFEAVSASAPLYGPDTEDGETTEVLEEGQTWAAKPDSNPFPGKLMERIPYLEETSKIVYSLSLSLGY